MDGGRSVGGGMRARAGTGSKWGVRDGLSSSVGRQGGGVEWCGGCRVEVLLGRSHAR